MTKQIIKTNGEKAVFQWTQEFNGVPYTEFVVATLLKEDRNKKAGEYVRDWVWGHYEDKNGLFTKESAIKFFDKFVKE